MAPKKPVRLGSKPERKLSWSHRKNGETVPARNKICIRYHPASYSVVAVYVSLAVVVVVLPPSTAITRLTNNIARLSLILRREREREGAVFGC